MGPTPLPCRLLVLMLMLLICPRVVIARQRMALVIGNAAYGELGVLRNPVHDATDIAGTLRQLGFAVTLLRDVDRRTMIEAIDTFSLQLRQGGAGVFYYAGHGVQVQGENYLIPVRAQISRELDVPYEAVPIGRILAGMEDANNQLNIVILDACRDNPYARQWRSSQRGLAGIQAAYGTLIAYATAPGAVAIDGSGRNGLYTSHVLQHLTTPRLGVEQLFKKVREGVRNATRGKQNPWESSSLIGDFFFVSSPSGSTTTEGRDMSSPSAAGSRAGGVDPEAEMWYLIKDSTQMEDILAFLSAFPNGRLAPVARLKLQQLQRQASPQRATDATRLVEQERQRREHEVAEAQRREQERQRREVAQRRDEPAQTAPQGTTTASALEVARLEPGPPKREEKIDRFIKYDNGTALDTRTHLLWMTRDFRNIEGRPPDGWHEAVEWADKMNQQRYGGYSDWRVPTTEEYKTIYEPTPTHRTYAGEPIGYPGAFENGGGAWFWSSEEFRMAHGGGVHNAYGVNFFKGSVTSRKVYASMGGKVYSAQGNDSVRLVRRGP